MPRKSARKSAPTPDRGPAELVVIASAGDEVIARRDVTHSAAAQEHVDNLLPSGVNTFRVFGEGNRLRAALAGTDLEDSGTQLLNTFVVQGEQSQLDDLVASLIGDDDVQAAYVKPPAQPPIAPPEEGAVEAVAPPNPHDAPPTTPDFTARQGYLDAAPTGVDARWAWTRPGGRGDGVQIIDVEGAWRFTHEDLLANQGGVIGGTQSTDIAWRNHGTAVAGEFGGDENSFGITGIAPNSNTRAISIFGGPGSAGAIRQAADALNPGDIILIELHRPGPLHNFDDPNGQEGFIAIEWWPDDWAAIRYAFNRGVVVVEAAGNGSQDFDLPLYETRPAGFPASWRNPLRATGPDSGAVIVGAGAPPPGTHGRNHGAARSRLGFSNWGARVDAQGWGREVTTAGYGDLQGGSDENFWYTDTFSGTSSASPIVVGAIAAYQGISAAGSGRRTPTQVRDRLRTTGSPQQDEPGRPATQRVGNLPDIRGLAGVLKKIEIKELKSEKIEKVERKEFKELKLEKLEKLEKKEFKERKSEFEKIPDRFDFEIDFDDIRQQLGGRLKQFQQFGQQQFGQKFGQQFGQGPSAAAPDQGSGGGDAAELAARLSALEGAVSELTHFIAQSLRPDLSDGALGYDEGEGEW